MQEKRTRKRDHQQTSAQTTVLQILARHHEPVAIAALARESGISRSTLSNALLGLIDKGDVVIAKVGRIGLYSLSEQGRAITPEPDGFHVGRGALISNPLISPPRKRPKSPPSFIQRRAR